LAFEIHPLSAVFVPPLAALLLLEDGRAILKDRRAWGLFAGGVAGLALYLAIHVLPYPETYSALTRLIYGPTHTPPIATGDLSVILQGVVDEIGLIFFAYLFGLVAILIGIVRLSFLRSKPSRYLLVLGLGMIISHALLVRNKFFYYAILMTPAIDLLVAGFLVEEIRAARARHWGRRLGLGLSLLGLGVSLVLYLLPLRTDQYQVYLGVQSRINAAVQPGDSIMGSQTYWFGLQGHTYYSWEQLVYYRRYLPGSPLEAAMEEFAPDVFVLDGHMREYLAEGNEGALYSGLLTLSRSDLNEILLRRGTLVDDFDGGGYGRIQVYRMQWSTARAHAEAQYTSPRPTTDPLGWTSPVRLEKRAWVANEE
jgi:uncharacterized membrane protein HdeD (DUF308 family)